ncbi:MAG: S1 RNA-binding domain-containing protein [Bacteroidota bacterium]
MSSSPKSSLTNLTQPTHAGPHYSPEELAQTTKWYEASLPKQLEDKVIIKSKVIAISPQYVTLDTGLKADGVVPFTEFKDVVDLKVGDEVEIYVEAIENKHGEIVLSRKKIDAIKAWQTIEEALVEKTPLEAIVQEKNKGGLDATIKGLKVFLPGSQIDIVPVEDHNIFLNKKIQVEVIKVNRAKKNVVVSRKNIIKNKVEAQKKSIISNLEEGQVLEGVVKNIEKYGAFVDLGGIVGLVYVKDMVWDRRIDHPDKAKDENGKPMFEIDKKIKVVVSGFDKEKNYVSLATKYLLPNPWDTLVKEVQEKSVIKCKVVKIMDYGAILETSYGTEAFIHSSDMMRSNYIHAPSEVLEIGQEVEAMVLQIDPEKQDLRVGMKQLIPDPWQEASFSEQYELGSRHQAKAVKFTEHGVYFELKPGVEGFVHNRHLSWTKRIHNPAKILEKNINYEVVVLAINDDKKILDLGFREIREDSPWEKFQNHFVPGSTHKATLLRKLPQGFIVQLAQGPETFVANRDLSSKEKIEINQELNFMIMEVIRHEEKIRISHNALFDTNAKPAKTKQYTKPIDLITAEKTTLRDIALVKDTTKDEKKEDKAPIEEEKK